MRKHMPGWWGEIAIRDRSAPTRRPSGPARAAARDGEDGEACAGGVRRGRRLNTRRWLIGLQRGIPSTRRPATRRSARVRGLATPRRCAQAQRRRETSGASEKHAWRRWGLLLRTQAPTPACHIHVQLTRVRGACKDTALEDGARLPPRWSVATRRADACAGEWTTRRGGFRGHEMGARGRGRHVRGLEVRSSCCATGLSHEGWSIGGV